MAMLTFGFPQQTEPAPSSGPMTDILRSAVAYRQNAAVGPAVMQEAVQRLQSIGSDRAQQMAQLVQSNPRAAQAMVADAGGWSQYVAQLEAEARERQAGMATGQALAQSGMPQFEALAQLDPRAALSVAQLFQRAQPQAPKPQYKQVLDPETRQWVYRDVTQGGNYVAPGPYGTQMTVGPDNSVTFASGPGVGGASSADATVATKQTINKLQDKQINLNEQMARFEQIESVMTPEALTLWGQLSNWKSQGKDWLGIGLSPEETEKFTNATLMKQSVVNNIARYILEMSGKAATDAERAFLASVQPSMDDTPLQFQAKLKQARRYTEAMAERNMYYLKQGRIAEFESGDVMDPNRFRQLKQKRVDALQVQIQRENPDMPAGEVGKQAKRIANQELQAGMPWE